MELKDKIKKFCNSLGLNNIGFIECKRFDDLEKFLKYKKEKGILNEFEEEDIEKRIDPKLLMKEGKTIISIAFPYFYEDVKKDLIYFSKYTLGMDYHIIVKEYLNKIGEYIVELGGNYKCFVDNNPLPERYIAMKSGVGFIGKNNCLITEEYGSYIFLGEIITDLYIEEDKPIKNKCGECNKCTKACPTKAILNWDTKNNASGINNNSNVCLSYINQKKQLEDVWIKKIGGRIWGCDTCQDVCPFNQNIKKSNLEAFKPIEYMKKPNLEELSTLDKRTFNEKYKSIACSWRGKNILTRNTFIALKNIKKEIPHIDKFNSPYVEEYYNKIKNLK
ncbi:tRNA epoxyqueuosine(34) reductase QueG [Hathewaya histolytica]|uniref:Iron-sulfur cluster-binding protein n=1 Tax=Hathewaya histolytica TaxID=1498 RepID=A0A4V6KET7_HATHI|nr:tRNA epoxyqueuosine(34) reductase QueG [Hathewaya histolytica]VTQ93997.1 iron-sulfur cluster-binding protein [Hathewaya histolytica]